MRTVSLCGEHKNDHYCEKCKELKDMIQDKNPCYTCNAHTNDEICGLRYDCKRRKDYEKWRIINGYDPAFDPELGRKMQKAGLI